MVCSSENGVTMLPKELRLTEIHIPPRFISLLFAALLLLLWRLTGIAQAQPAPWKSEKGYENGIPIGTKITQANWQQYQEFMPESMIHLFKGDLFWHMPQGIEI